MTLNDFIKKYDGKKVEFHSFSAGALYQCVDSANAYITEVLGLPAIIGTNAQDFPTKRGQNYDWILNTPTGVPSPGDLMIFKSPDNVGHISIFVEGDANSFKSFDQNYPTGSPSKIVTHNYKNVIGWMHPKGTMAETIQVEKAVFEQLVTKATKYDEIVKTGYVTKADHDKRVDELNAQNNSHITEITALQKENAQLKQDLADCESHEPDTDPAGWVKNGLMIEVTEGNKKTTTNYERA